MENNKFVNIDKNNDFLQGLSGACFCLPPGNETYSHVHCTAAKCFSKHGNFYRQPMGSLPCWCSHMLKAPVKNEISSLLQCLCSFSEIIFMAKKEYYNKLVCDHQTQSKSIFYSVVGCNRMLCNSRAVLRIGNRSRLLQ